MLSVLLDIEEPVVLGAEFTANRDLQWLHLPDALI